MAGFAPGRYFIGELPPIFTSALAIAADPTVPEEEATASLEDASAVLNEQAFNLYVCSYPSMVVHSDKVANADQMGGTIYAGYRDLRHVSVLAR